jgi:5-methyltetrahydropteroyltriglutamate--homocysteine methyltransferase
VQHPYRADQVGSLLRPAELLEARQTAAKDPERLREIEDRNILRVLKRQKELGFDIFTDGEFRRLHFMSDFTDAVEGFDMGGEVARSWKGEEEKKAPVSRIAGIVTKKLKRVRRLAAHEAEFLTRHSPGDIKITLPSATQFPAISFQYGVTDQVYKDPTALLQEVAEIMKSEMEQLADEGVRYIQIDAPRYSYFMDPKWRDWMQREMRIDPDAMLDASIEADNRCFQAAQREGVTLAIHLCRGNNRSQWYAEGGYDAIAEKMFGTLAVDRFLLEYDDARSGTFEPLRFVPKGKTVVLGFVSTKHPQMEIPSELIRRIEKASQHVPLEGLALSPQCGFASTMEGNLLTEDQQWAKLRLVVETARQVW